MNLLNLDAALTAAVQEREMDRAEHERTLAAMQAGYEQKLAETQAEHEQKLAEAQAEHEQKLATARDHRARENSCNGRDASGISEFRFALAILMAFDSADA